MKKVIYTCIIGNYDNVNDGHYRTPGFDYICYTDNPDLKSNFWTIRQIPSELKEDKTLDNTKKNRYIKLNPHLFFKDYDFSVYIDGAITMKRDLSKFIEDNCMKNILSVPRHPKRTCIYEEANACIKGKKDTKENINPQIERYHKEGFPKNYGLTQNNIIFRFHNDEKCIRLMETWWNEVKNGSRRDQLSFMYSLWKNKDIEIKYLDSKTCESLLFSWDGTHKKKYPAPKVVLSKLIKYRTYYKDEQYTRYNLANHEANVMVINTNDEKYPFSKKLNKYWSEYAIIKAIWKLGKKSEYVGIEQFADTLPSDIKLDELAIYYKKCMTLSRGIYGQYKSFHVSDDMDILVEVLKKKYGEKNKYVDYIMNGKKFYYGSIFVMKWDVFDKMCNFVFGVLDDLDKKLGLNFDEKKYEEYFTNPKRKQTKVAGKENYQMRAFGFMAERLVSAFIICDCNGDGKSVIPLKKTEIVPKPTVAPQESLRDEIIRDLTDKPKIKLHPTTVTINKTTIKKPKVKLVKKTKVFLGGGLNW